MCTYYFVFFMCDSRDCKRLYFFRESVCNLCSLFGYLLFYILLLVFLLFLYENFLCAVFFFPYLCIYYYFVISPACLLYFHTFLCICVRSIRCSLRVNVLHECKNSLTRPNFLSTSLSAGINKYIYIIKNACTLSEQRFKSRGSITTKLGRDILKNPGEGHFCKGRKLRNNHQFFIKVLSFVLILLIFLFRNQET